MKIIGFYILLLLATSIASCSHKSYNNSRNWSSMGDLYQDASPDNEGYNQNSGNLINTPDNYSLGYRQGISDGINLTNRNIYHNAYLPYYYNWNFGLDYYWDPFLFRYGSRNYFWSFNNPWGFNYFNNPWYWNYYTNPWWNYSYFCGPFSTRDWRFNYAPLYRRNLNRPTSPRYARVNPGLYQYRNSLSRAGSVNTTSSRNRNFFRRNTNTSESNQRNNSRILSAENKSLNTRESRYSRNRSNYSESNSSINRTYTPSTPRTYTPSTTTRTYTPSTPRSTYTPRTYTPSTPRSTYTPRTYTPSTPRSTYTPRTYTPSTPRSTYTPRTYTPSTPRSTYTPRTYTPSYTPRTYTPSYTPSRTAPSSRSRF